MVAVALIGLFAAAGCATWKPIKSMGVPGPALDKQLEKQSMRYYQTGSDEVIETKILKSMTPFVEIPPPDGAPIDPVTGKKARAVVDLRLLDGPEVKIVDKPARNFLIVTGSAVGAGLIALAFYGLVSGINGLNNTHVDLGNLR